MAKLKGTRKRLRHATQKNLEALRSEFHDPPEESGKLGETRVPLRKLAVAPHVFQPRNFDEEPWEKERHIENLSKVIRQGRELDPILVYPVCGFLVVLDGHLRLEAYRDAGLSPDDELPVELFGGTVIEARLWSLEANSKDKLSLTKTEKLEAAWQLMKDREGKGNPSYSQIE